MINLVTKYGTQLDEGFARRSYTAGKASRRFSWDGAEGIKILHTLPTQLTDYNNTASSNRFGTPTNVQDAVQYMKIRKKRSYSAVIDKTHNSMQMYLKKAAKYMKQQDMDVYIPEIDQYNLKQWAENAGQDVTASSAPTASTIVAFLTSMETKLRNKLVPKRQCWTYIGESMYTLIRLADEWQGCDSLVNKVLAQGHVGNFGMLNIIPVPDSEMPASCYALVAHQESVFAPTTLSEARILREAPGISGALLEALRVYDAFVDWCKADGVCALIASSAKESAPTVSVAGQITVGSGKTVKYTLDGTDPRYSDSAVTITSTATPTHTAGDVIKAVVLGTSGTSYRSDVTTTVTTS